MTIDYAHPLPADLYDSATQPDVLEYIRDNMVANAKWLEGMDPAGKQTGFKRINSGLLEEWNGTAWVSKALGYVPKTGATDITGSLGMQTAGFGGYQVHITDAPANKKKTMMAGQSDGQSYFGQLNDAGSTWTAGMRIGADGKAYDIASGLPFVTTNPVGAYLPLTGGTLTGTLTIAQPAGNDSVLAVNAATGDRNASVMLKTNGVDRWRVIKGGGTESGSNAASNFHVQRFSDTGSYLGDAFSITRTDGWATFGNNVTINGSLIVTSNSTFNGPFTVQNSSKIQRTGVDVLLEINGNPGYSKGLMLEANDVVRWKVLSHVTNDDYVVERFNDAGVFQGAVIHASRASGLVTLSNELTVSGQARSNWGYQCRNGTAGAFGANTFNIYWDGDLWIVIDNLKLKITIPALFADEEIAKAKPQALESKWFDTLQPQVAISSSELIPEGKLAGLIPGDPEPSLLLGQMILQIQDLKRRVSALERV